MNWVASFKQVSDWFKNLPLTSSFSEESNGCCIWSHCQIHLAVPTQLLFLIAETWEAENWERGVPVEWMGWSVDPVLFLWNVFLLSYLILISPLYSSLFASQDRPKGHSMGYMASLCQNEGAVHNGLHMSAQENNKLCYFFSLTIKITHHLHILMRIK